jgi:hypothetical protein
MEVLKIVTVATKEDKNHNPFVRYTFSDGRNVNHFYVKNKQTAFAQGDEVEVELEKDGQYWNLKSIKSHGAQAPEPPATPIPMDNSYLRLECLKVAATRYETVDTIITAADEFFKFITQ